MSIVYSRIKNTPAWILLGVNICVLIYHQILNFWYFSGIVEFHGRQYREIWTRVGIHGGGQTDYCFIGCGNDKTNLYQGIQQVLFKKGKFTFTIWPWYWKRIKMGVSYTRMFSVFIKINLNKMVYRKTMHFLWLTVQWKQFSFRNSMNFFAKFKIRCLATRSARSGKSKLCDNVFIQAPTHPQI